MSEHVGKTIPIELEQVVRAYHKVRQGGKATGIDHESWEEFDRKVESNLFVIWNRMSSGSYLPQAVREVEIPKKDGKMRRLGIPTLRDRIAQQVVKEYMEKRIDHLFHENSYGYRPLKSAHQAAEQVRQNCYKLDWVIDLDINKFFDEIDHELMLKAVEHVMEEKWVKMYVLRWLQMPVEKKDGTLEQKEGKGTPQGGVISPILANLYLHYALDMWLAKHYPKIRFVRYADDVVIHCASKEEADEVLAAVGRRLAEVKLQINSKKTHIAYCKDYKRREKYVNVKFDFLGFGYQPRARKDKRNGKLYSAFTAEINQSNMKRIREVIRETINWRNTRLELTEIARAFNPKLRGWIRYFGIYSIRSLRFTLWTIDKRLIKWLSKKHEISLSKSILMLNSIKRANPALFYHWEVGY
ncbi:MAG: group II intron reverse transcriptase/maturase [Bacteroidota bacterium]|nr:group II intron reverse transcriptase/maturase [Bacteroidota bacterium]